MKRFLAGVLALILCLSLGGCGAREAETDEYADVPNPVATITMTDGSVMRLELYLSYAPNTVANFIELANKGFYDGLTFFRVVAGCLVQSGDPNNDGTGGPGYTIDGEFSQNGFAQNTLSHTRGVISMARMSDYNSAGSQFFILQGSFPEYDGKYAAFGKTMDEESLSTLDKIASVMTDAQERPLVYSIIKTIRVETNGYQFPVIKNEEKNEEK